MSIQALTWVIYGVAPDIKHADFRTLLVLADHADPQGMGAYPSRSTISRLTGYSVRTVSYALKSLESSGLISRGDQRIVAGLGGYKPTVWNRPDAVVIGMEPADYHTMEIGLTPVCQARLPDLAGKVVEELRARGVIA